MEGDKMMNKEEEEEEDDDVLLPGFRFHPTDEELVGFYLRRKVDKKPLSIELIKAVDVYKFDPWDLPKVTSAGDKEMYFFCMRERKYRNSIRPNRVTGSGFWKATGIDRPIYKSAGAGQSNDCIGLKKSLVYYRGSAGKGTKTDWMMHEFRLPTSGKSNKPGTIAYSKNPILEPESWTLCRIFKRNATYRRYAPGWREPSSIKLQPSDSSSQACSVESVNRENSVLSPVIQQKVHERSPVTQIFPEQFGSVTPTPSTPVYSNNINFRANGFMRDDDWNELDPMVEFAYNPALLYGWI